MRVTVDATRFIKALLLMMCLPCLNFNTVNVLGACHVDVALSSKSVKDCRSCAY